MERHLYTLIEASYSKMQAEAFLSFRPSDEAVRQLQDYGNTVLKRFPYKPAACALMTAMLAVLIRDRTEYPIHAFAGSLFVDGVHVFGRDFTPIQPTGAISGPNLDWDGHCWIVFGNLIADVSLCRTAYSQASPPALKRNILAEFGKGRGLLIAPSDAFAEKGIFYDAKHALTEDVIGGLYNCALDVIDSHDRESAE